MHRSGTSALTRVVNLLGAAITRDLMPPHPGNNDAGFWESNEIVRIHDRLLHALGSSYDDPLPLPERWPETEAALQARWQIAGEIRREFHDSRLFVVKDPRIARLLPLWLDLLGELGIEAVVVIPVRNPLEVALSLYRREQMPFAVSFHLYLRSYLEIELASRAVPRRFVEYRRLLNNWRLVARELGHVAGLALPDVADGAAAEIDAFLQQELYRNRSTREELVCTPQVPEANIQIFDCMTDAAERGNELGLRGTFDRLRAITAEATKMFQGIVVAERNRHR